MFLSFPSQVLASWWQIFNKPALVVCPEAKGFPYVNSDHQISSLPVVYSSEYLISSLEYNFFWIFTKHGYQSTDLCRVVIAAFLVHQILRVFNVIRRVQFTRDTAAVVWHALPLHETFYLAQLAVWLGHLPDEVPFQSFSNEMVNEIQGPAVICWVPKEKKVKKENRMEEVKNLPKLKMYILPTF